ncbi:hypothetical protein Pmani_017796 [Petrolisthes manimaculis]|uniref:Uncharacterized protein n=1 Tax=Petrolisthes manimaculis TaxID=1843537 RepID=A0AAE1PL47_9EUCA|nr:hypothetical protein Pmani_017796 [Petrolisthes manimaculis]
MTQASPHNTRNSIQGEQQEKEGTRHDTDSTTTAATTAMHNTPSVLSKSNAFLVVNTGLITSIISQNYTCRFLETVKTEGR